jgi:hypothetical protein
MHDLVAEKAPDKRHGLAEDATGAIITHAVESYDRTAGTLKTTEGREIRIASTERILDGQALEIFIARENVEKLKYLARTYREMPNGGAALLILQDGRVSNGMAIVASFSGVADAVSALKEAGFTERHYGWKFDPEPRRFTAYKVYTATQERAGFVPNLTLEEARDERRFPLGPQTDASGQFIWSYGLNEGRKIV